MYEHSMFSGSLRSFVSIPMIDITPAFASSSRLNGALPAAGRTECNQFHQCAPCLSQVTSPKRLRNRTIIIAGVIDFEAGVVGGDRLSGDDACSMISERSVGVSSAAGFDFFLPGLLNFGRVCGWRAMHAFSLSSGRAS